MKYLNIDFINISIIDDQTVLVEAKYGVEIDAEKSKYANDLIENEMPGHYGMIIDRKSDYSIVPLDVYKVLNEHKNLKAIAIVVHNKRNSLPLSTEKKLFKGELEIFESIKQAHEWISKVINTKI